MEAFILTARQLGILSVLFLAGYVIREKDYITDETVKGFSFTLLNVFLPATVFMSFQIEYSKEILFDGIIMALSFAGVMLFGYIIAFISTNAFGISGEERQVWFGGAMMFNCLFIGLPIINALCGDEGVLYLCFGIVGWNIVSYTIGIQVFKKKGDKIDIIGQFRKILFAPSIIACILGILIYVLQISIPSALSDSLKYLSNATIPISMLFSGALVSKQPIKELFQGKDVYLLSAIRLIIIPVVVLFVLNLFMKNETARNTVVISAATPVGTIATVFAEQFSDSGKTAAKYWVVSTILSLISLPVISYIITVF